MAETGAGDAAKKAVGAPLAPRRRDTMALLTPEERAEFRGHERAVRETRRAEDEAVEALNRHLEADPGAALRAIRRRTLRAGGSLPDA